MHDGPGQKYVQAELLPQIHATMDWEQKPFQFKLYQNTVQLKLPYRLSPNHRETSETSLTPQQIGEILSNSYGLLQQYTIRLPQSAGMPAQKKVFSQALRRPVPSGGALFPCEIYLFIGTGQHLPAGIYHYDVAHHALDVLQNIDGSETACSYLAHLAYREHGNRTYPAYIIALSCFFWKDGFKYGDFSYRLQGLDLGTVIAQCVAVLQQQTIATTVHYQFLDANIDALLGLNPQHESVYALITLDSLAAASQITPQTTRLHQQDMPVAAELESIARWPLVEAVHQAAIIKTREQFRSLRCLPPIALPPATASYALPLVSDEPSLLAGYPQRHSAQGRFVPTPIDMPQLARLCHLSTTGYENDLDGPATVVQHTALYCLINRVKGLPQGIYCYDPHKHTLELVVAGDLSAELQVIQLRSQLNVRDMSVCFFSVGDYNAGFHTYEDRWYRIQNMEAGMIVQRLYLISAALHLGCRASLGFYQRAARALLRLPEHWNVLIQIMIAPEAYSHGYYEQSIYPC